MIGTLRALELLIHDDRGQDLLEYALIAMMIALAAVGAFAGLGTAIANKYTEISNAF